VAVNLSLTSDGPGATQALGAVIGQTLLSGDVIALSGELGAGKTCLVKGLATGLGIDTPITSPTFVLLRNHDGGRVPLVHVDVYRLDRLSEIEGLGDDVLSAHVVTVIEWGDTVDAVLPANRLLIEIDHLGDGDARAITIHGAGDWEARAPGWSASVMSLPGVAVAISSAES